MTEEDYKFIEEKIKPQKLRRITKQLKKMGFTAVLAVIFGVIAACAFYFTRGLFGSEENKVPKPTVTLPEKTESPVSTAEPVETKEPVKGNADKADKNTGKSKVTLDINDYSAMYQTLSDYCNKYKNTIVTVAKTKSSDDFFQTLIDNRDSFSGLVLQNDNDKMYVLTEYDEIEDGINYQIILSNEESVDAQVLGTDEATGLAVITADITEVSDIAKEHIKTAELGYSEPIKTGSLVVALGNPMGSMYSINYGIVNREPNLKNLIDRHVVLFGTDITYIDKGSGFIMNTYGKVIGIITHRFDEEDSSNASFIGVSEVKGLIEQLMNNEARGRVGIIVNDVEEEYLSEWGLDNGVYVTEVESGSAAMEAGVSVGDVVLSISGKPIESVGDYTSILSKHQVGSEINIDVYCTYAKKNVKRTITVKLGEVDADSSYK